MNDGDLLAAVEEGGLEGVPGEALGLLLGADLEGLEHAGIHLVLHAGVLALEVLSDDEDVRLGAVSGAGVREVEHVHDVRVQI